MRLGNNCHSMQVALKLLASVADVGFDLKKPEDREKRSQLVKGLFTNKYEYARAEKLALAKEKENVQTETKPVPAE